ncbi:hypothetical protein B0G84_6621 [Paraburkholderia sp. BL8N3]|nr:hypothetical protein [Paraburkholderia sp. BL8N3]TCK34663.1 hypothetical protein B0G84_6621 [Paraburkholderia sp. BL8N3]
MQNDLTQFELNWLLELAINGSSAVPRFIAARLRDLGYADQVFAETHANRRGRERLLAASPGKLSAVTPTLAGAAWPARAAAPPARSH